MSDVCFSRDGKLLLTGSWDGKARIWYAVTPVEDDVEQIKLSVETATGMHIGQSGATDLLSAAEWVERKKRIRPKQSEAKTSKNQ